jgi:hypothetical protein
MGLVSRAAVLFSALLLTALPELGEPAELDSCPLR